MFMILTITAIAFVEVLVVLAIILGVRITWNEIANAFPYTAAGEESVSRSFQSLKLGFFSLGMCFKISADTHALHFEPQHVLRWTGCLPASISYDEIEPGKHTFLKRHRVCKIHGKKITAPAWAIDLSDPKVDE